MRLQILSDLRQGIIRYYYRYIILFLIASSFTVQFILKANIYIQRYHIAGEISCIDCLLYMLKGMKEYTHTNPFDIPPNFLLLNLLLGILIGYYPVKDLHGMGLQMMVKSKKRIYWWCSKCIWNIVTVICYYAAIYMGILSMGVLFRTQITGGMHAELINKILGMEISADKEAVILIYLVILPIVTSIAISMFQMFLSFLLHPILSYIIIVIIYIFSAFYMRWFMPGNFLMFYRNCMINPNGIHFTPSILVDMFLFTFSIVAGYFYFRNIDILGKE